MTRRSAQERFVDSITAAGPAPWSEDDLAEVNVEPWMVDVLREAEADARALRSLLEDVLGGEVRRCACGTSLAGREDRRHCSAACRQRAYRARSATA